MLTSIELENYRGFRQYRLNKLSRVNLLVGKNGCGKTSVLEAVHLLASGGNLSVLATTARQRGEVIPSGETRDPYRREPYADVSHFFYGHKLDIDTSFRLRSSDGLGELTVRIVNLPDLEDAPRLFREETDPTSAFAIRFESVKHGKAHKPRTYPVSEEGALGHNIPSHPRRVSRSLFDEAPFVQFIASDSLQPGSMNEMWDNVQVDGREPEVIRAMQILEPRLVNIIFLSSPRTAWSGGKGGVLVAVEGAKRRIPLGSYGEGMQRLLALSLSLIQTAGGILLVDEIDTGLHWSIMGDMWKLLVNAARQSNVQVFATTHSQDCVRGLAWLCENHPELGTDVSLQKIDKNLDETVALAADQIQIAVEQDIEVR